MGASQKRKDARKRKFGDLDASIVDDATTVSPRRKQGKKVSPANDTIKRQKTDLENVPLSLDETEAEIINVEESPEVLRTDDSEPNDQNPTKSNKQKSKPSESVTQTESKTKSQTKERFIVFIGKSSPSSMPMVSYLIESAPATRKLLTSDRPSLSLPSSFVSPFSSIHR